MRPEPSQPGTPPATTGGSPRRVEDAESVGPPTGLLAEFPAVQRLERILALAPAAVLFAMMVLTFVNVVLRYGFRAPISGALELLSYMMGLLVFLSLPLVTARSEHVRISVLDGIMPVWLRRIRAVIFNLLMAVICGLLGWRMWLFAERLLSWGDKTQKYGLSLGGLAQLFSVSCALMAVLFALTALRVAISRDAVERVET
ncbi:MAG: TRAP transporter small permease [Gemmobacter sp.]